MVIAVDVGTSSARASAYGDDGRPVAGLHYQVPYEPRLTGDGGVEHEPRTLLAAVAACLDAVCARAGRATVRDHLKRVFDTTGARSQVALVALLRGFVDRTQ